MSRIEKAMEQAAQIRKGKVAAGEFQIQQPERRPVHTPPPVEIVTGRFVPSNPFIVNMNDPHSPIVEEFRKLKSALVNLTTRDVFKNTILVTSSVPNEG